MDKELCDKTINIKESTKKMLIDLKVHPRETFDDIIMGLIKEPET